MRDYGKIYCAFWGAGDIKCLSDQGKLLAAYLLTSRHNNLVGCFPLPIGYIQADLDWDREKVSRALSELLKSGFVTIDEIHGWVLITKYLFWNPLQNRNQGKAAKKLYEQVPSESPLKSVLAGLFQQHGRFLPEGLANHSETVSKEFGNSSETVSVEYKNGSGTLSKPGKGEGTVAGTVTGAVAGSVGVSPQGIPPAIPAFLVAELEGLGVKVPTIQQSLFNDLGRSGLHCAIVKLKSKKTQDRNLAGLLVRRGSELAAEGQEMLQAWVMEALESAPGALDDPRWVAMPVEIREDLEVQGAWAKWIASDRASAKGAKGEGSLDLINIERSFRWDLVQLLKARHPDQDRIREASDRNLAEMPRTGLTARALSLESMTRTFALVPGGVP